MLLALDLSRVTFNRIRLNFFWAMAYNVVMLPMAAGALYPCVHMQIPPWVAGACSAVMCCDVIGSLPCQLLSAVLRNVLVDSAVHSGCAIGLAS